MPFTPFHLGAGAALKAVGGRHFSFMVFGGSQILMDIEPLVGILRGSSILHGYSHTLAGASLIGLVAALTGKPVSAFVLRALAIPHYPLTWSASFCAAFCGTFTHIALDAIMHGDMRPWWPLASGNDLLHAVTLGKLHLLCVGLGLSGGLVVAIRTHTHGRA